MTPAILSTAGPEMLASVVGYLWPPGESEGRTELLAFPSIRRPRVLVPREPKRPAAAGLESILADRTVRGRARRMVASRTASRGVSLPRTRTGLYSHVGGVTSELAQLVGCPVVPVVRLGPPRANLKPVIAVVRQQDAVTFGYAKVGLNDLTRRLVRHEAGVLTSFHGRQFEVLRVPRVIASGRWGGSLLPVMESVTGSSARPVPDAALVAAVRDVAATGTSATVPLEATPLWRSSRTTVTARTGRPAGELSEAITATQDVLGDVSVEVGAWHGDWNPGNSAYSGGKVSVWDWERYELGAPIGVDALHYRLHQISARSGHQNAAIELVRTAPEILRPYGVHGGAVSAVVAAYIAAIASRYVADDQASALGRGGDVESWAVPALRHLSSSHHPPFRSRD